MGWLPVVIGAVASMIFYHLNAMIWLGVSVLLTAIDFWSWGVMHNYAIDAARERPGFRGGFYDITSSEAELGAKLDHSDKLCVCCRLFSYVDYRVDLHFLGLG